MKRRKRVRIARRMLCLAVLVQIILVPLEQRVQAGAFPGLNGKIALPSTASGPTGNEIYVMNADGSEQTRLTSLLGIDSDPSFSPDGSRIAFVASRGAPYDVYVMNGDDGSAQTRLTTDPADDASPSWSPDGSKIAFNSNRDGNYEIYVMNSDGSAQTRLTNDFALEDLGQNVGPYGR